MFDSSPQVWLESLAQSVKELDEITAALAQEIPKLSEAQSIYDKEMNQTLVQIHNKHSVEGTKSPGVDMCKAIAFTELSPNVYLNYLRSKATVDALKERLKGVSAALNGKQSLIRGLSTESHY